MSRLTDELVNLCIHTLVGSSEGLGTFVFLARSELECIIRLAFFITLVGE